MAARRRNDLTVRAKDALSIGALDHLVVNREALADAARTAIAGGIERTPVAKCADPEALIAAERAGVAAGGAGAQSADRVLDREALGVRGRH